MPDDSSRDWDQVQKVLDSFFTTTEQTFDQRALPEDLMIGQFRWNNMISEIHEDSLEGEDVYSVCLGYMLGFGYTPDEAHRIASHPKTEL